MTRFNWLWLGARSNEKCKHNFSKWRIIHNFLAERAGVVKVIQSRACTKCGYTQIDTQEK